MTDIRSDIIINVDTSIGIAEIKNLQRQIAELNAQLIKSGAQQAKSAQNIQRNLINNINSTGQFAANVKTISSTAESFTTALERNKLGMGEYFRYAGGASKTFGKVFRKEFDTIQQVAESRVKTLQTQYVKLGRDANGALKAISVRPLVLDMDNLATKTAIAAQKQQLFNQLLKQGSTNLLNFGKNTQWAGRQLMVGFSIPLAYIGTFAGKTFMKMEEQAIRFKRVYGDSFTASSETDKMVKQVQDLAKEFTKYGVAVEKTMEMAADAAAMGLMNADLLAQISQSTRLAVLGGVEQEQALETTISLMSAFGTSAKDLTKDIDFLNAVENQTVTAIEDLTIAIPKAAPVIKQLGGNVQDLAFFLTAMKEGGINASEGANALKSGLASLINPSEKSAKFLADLGINIKGIVEGNAGDVKNTVIEFAQALDTLDPLNRARAIEQLFGKFQFSRLSTLFQNVVKEGTQAQRVLQLTRNSTEELAILSERELKRVEDSPMYKLKKAFEDLKVSLVPLGEAFVKAITPIVEFAKGFLDRFNQMGDGAKQFAVIATTVVAGIGPILLMTFGLIANGVANLIKMFTAISGIFRGAGKSSLDLGNSTEYMTQQQLEAAAVAASLDQSHSKLIQTFGLESAAVDKLAISYAKAVVAQSRLLGVPLGPKNPAGQKPMKLRTGIVSVPGPKGAGDIVPAMLSPGEAVIPAKQSQKYAGLISGMINDDIPGYRIGRNPFASMLKRSRVAVRTNQSDLETMLQAGKDGRYKSAFATGTGADYVSTVGLPNPVQKKMRSQMEEKIFGLPFDSPESNRPTYGYARTSPIQAIINRLFGFKGKQYNAITAGTKIGDQGGKSYWTNPKTGTYEANPKFRNDTLSRYGDVDLITKKGVGRRSKVAASDILLDFKRTDGRTGIRPAPMRGASQEQLDKSFINERIGKPFGRYQADPIKEPQYWTSNPQVPYVETYTPGGFGMREVSRIIAKDRSTAKQLQKLVDKAGLKIRVTPQNAPLAIRALSSVFGTRFEDGTTGVVAPKWSSMDFNQKLTLQMSHMSEAASGAGTLTRAQVIKQFEDSVSSGIKSGSFSRLGIDPSALRAEFDKKMSDDMKDVKTFKLYGNIVEPWVSGGNQGTANPNATRPAKDYLRELRSMPKGLFGSGILARLPKNHGIPDNTLKSYILRIQKSYTSELKKVYGQEITEAKTQEMYKKAEQAALKKVKHPAARKIISDANLVGRLGLTPGTPGKKVDSGYSRRYLSSLWGNVQKGTRNLRSNGQLKSLFGEKFIQQLDNNFLTKTKIDLPPTLKAIVNPLLKSLPRKAEIELAKRLIADSELGQGNREQAFKRTVDLAKSGKILDAPSVAPKPVRVKQEPANEQKIKTDSSLKGSSQAIEQDKEDISRVLGVTPNKKTVPVRPVSRNARANAFARIFGGLKLNSGIVSVPGPKGAGDVVPAMLSPGEAVIPTKMADRYAPLINGMISGNIPGYAKGKGKKGASYGDKYTGTQSRSSAKAGTVLTETSPQQGVVSQRRVSSNVTQKELATLKKQLKGSTFKRAVNAITTNISGAIATGIQNANLAKVMTKDYVAGYKERFKAETAITDRQMAERDKRVQRASQARRDAKWNKKYSESTNAKMFGPNYKDATSGRFVSSDTVNSRFAQFKDDQRFQKLKAKSDARMAKDFSKFDKKYGDAGLKMVRSASGASYYDTANKTFLSKDAAQTRMAEADKERKDVRKKKLEASKGKIGAGAGGLGSVGMMAGMGMSMSEDPGMQQAGQAVMGASMFLSLLPMMMNPIGAVVGGLAALAAVIILVNEEYKKNVKESYNLQMATGGSAKALKAMAEFSGNVTAGEQMDRRRAQGADVFQVAAGKSGFGKAFLESEAGKSTFASFQEVYKNQGSAAAAESLTNQMATAVASGALKAGQARDVVAAIGAELNDYSFSIKVNSELLSLLGPNGENLLTDPLRVRTQIIEDNRAGISSFLGEPDEEINLDPTQIGAFVARSSIALQSQQEMVDSLQVEYEQRIANAKAAGDLVEATRLEKEFAEARNALMSENQVTIKEIQEVILSANNAGDILEQFKTMTDEVYKDDPIAMALLNANESKLDALDDDKEVIVRAALLSEDLSPTALDQLINGENSEKEIDLLVKLGSAGYGQVSGIADLFGDETVGVTANAEDARTGKKTQVSAAQKFKDDMALMDPAEAMEYAESFNPVISTFSALGTDALAAGMSFYLENPEELEKANEEVDLFAEKAKDGVTMEIVQEVYGQDMVDKIATNQAYFDSLPPDQQIRYTTVLRMLGEMDPEALRIQAIASAIANDTNFKKESGGLTYNQAVGQYGQAVADSMAKDAFVTGSAETVTEAGNTKNEEEDKTETPTPSKGPKQKDPYEDLLSDLKRVRNSTIDVTGGLKELQRVLGKGINMKALGGVESKLLESPEKISAPLASYFASLDAKTQKLYFTIGKNGKMVLTQAGKLWKQAFDERAIGDAYVGLQGSLKILKQQSSATKTLVSYGLDWATASELAGDAELAAAIASKKNVEEIQKIVKLKKEELSLTRQTAAANKIQENFAEGASLAQMAGFSLEEQKVISATKELQLLLQEGKGRDDATFRQLLAQEIAKTIYERQVAATNAVKEAINDFKKSRNLDATIRSQLPQLGSVTVQTILNDPALMDLYRTGGEALGQSFYDRLNQLLSDPANLAKVFEAGLSNAFSAFDIQEKAVELKFQQDTKQFTDVEDGIIPKAERRIALIEDQVDDYEYMLETISSKEQEINEKYDARYRALEKIHEVNQRLVDQQQSQLDIAGALSRGDISAAATAVQAYRAKVAQTQMDNQKQALDLAKEKELNALTADYNGKVLTRKQIEKEVKDLRKQILEIQEKEVEPAEKSLRLATDARDIAISNVSVLGLQRAEWEQIQNNVDKASINNAAFVTSLTAALSVTEALKKAYGELGGSTPGSVNVATTPAPGATAQFTTPTTEKPVVGPTLNPDSTGPTDVPVPAELNPPAAVAPKELTQNEKFIAELNRRITTTRWRFNNEKLTTAQKNDLRALNEKRIKEVVKLGGMPNMTDVTEPGKTTKIIDYLPGFASGGLIPKRFAVGGFAMGTDTVPAMLTPGEFVVRKYAVDNFGADNLRAINTGKYSGESVYNYEVNINVKSDANADQIARAVMTQIKQVDSQRIRGNRF